MPADDEEAGDLHDCLLQCKKGEIINGWGEVSYWSVDRVESGDWTPGVWRSPELAEAGYIYANHTDLRSIKETSGVAVLETGRTLRGSFTRTKRGTLGSFPILKSKGADGQKTIQSSPEEYRIPKKRDANLMRSNKRTYAETEKILQKAGYLLITAGQNTSTARLTATADDEQYVGYEWMPVTGLTCEEAKATAVFINSTPGRLQLMRSPGKTLAFPTYSVAEVANIRIPDVNDTHAIGILAHCWERTKDMIVPQFRDGECEVRRLWDESVAEAMDWDADELSRLRHLLHKEPHVSGLGYNQYADDSEE